MTETSKRRQPPRMLQIDKRQLGLAITAYDASDGLPAAYFLNLTDYRYRVGVRVELNADDLDRLRDWCDAVLKEEVK